MSADEHDGQADGDARDHPDNQKVLLLMWVVDMTARNGTPDFPAAIFLSQLLWWAQPGTNGKPRMTFRAGKPIKDADRKVIGREPTQTWLTHTDKQWHHATRLTPKQLKDAKRRLEAMGLIERTRVMRGRWPVSAVRPVMERVRELSELSATESGSAPEGPTGSDLQGPTGSAPEGPTGRALGESPAVEPSASSSAENFTRDATSDAPKDDDEGQEGTASKTTATASPSSRSSSFHKNATSDEQPAGLTPCPENPGFGGATSSDKQLPAADRVTKAAAVLGRYDTARHIENGGYVRDDGAYAAECTDRRLRYSDLIELAERCPDADAGQLVEIALWLDEHYSGSLFLWDQRRQEEAEDAAHVAACAPESTTSDGRDPGISTGPCSACVDGWIATADDAQVCPHCADRSAAA